MTPSKLLELPGVSIVAMMTPVADAPSLPPRLVLASASLGARSTSAGATSRFVRVATPTVPKGGPGARRKSKGIEAYGYLAKASMVGSSDEHVPQWLPGAAVNAIRWVAAALTVAGAALLIDRTVPAVDLSRLGARWWPLALILLGVVGVLRLLPTANAMLGPLLLVAVGGVGLLFTLRPLPGWITPLLLPLVLLAAGITLSLAGRSERVRHQGIGRSVRRETMVASGGPLDWDPSLHPLLTMRAFVGGCLLTVKDAQGKGMLDIRAALSGINVIVPPGLTVHIDARGLGFRLRRDREVAIAEADTADLRIVVLSAFTTLNVSQ